MTNTEIDSILGSFPTIADSEQHMAEALRSNYRLRRTRKDRSTYKYSNGFFSLLLHDNELPCALVAQSPPKLLLACSMLMVAVGSEIFRQSRSSALSGRSWIRTFPNGK